MASEYAYSGLSISNPVTGTTKSVSGALEPDVFSSTVITEKYVVTEADVLAAINNGGNLAPGDVQVACSGDRGTIVVDSSKNVLNVYAPNLIATHYEPFLKIDSDYDVPNGASVDTGYSVSYSWEIKNLSKTTITNATLTTLKNGTTSPFTLSPRSTEVVNMHYIVQEDDMYSGSIVESGTVNATSFAGTPIKLTEPMVIYVAKLNLQATLTYTNTSTGQTKIDCSQGDTVSYTATIRNTGNAPLHDVHFHDSISGQNQEIGTLNVNETRTFTYTTTMTVTNEVVNISGSISAYGKDGRSATAIVNVLKCYVDYSSVAGWSYKVNVDSSLKSSIPFCLYGDENSIELSVDWGDGTTSTLTSSNFSSADDPSAAVHQYASQGEYTITIDSSDWSNTYICSYGSSMNESGISSESEYENISRFKSTVTEILTGFPGLRGTCFYDYYDYSYEDDRIGNPFQSCAQLRAIPSDLFSNVSSFENFSYCFSDCTSLTSIPEGLFDGLYSATTFQNCFYGCTSLTSIPEGLFDDAIEASTFWSCFQNCSSLTSIPEYLFAYNTAANDFDYAFDGCTSIEDFTLHIGSENVSYCSDFIPYSGSGDRIIYVPSGSYTESLFASIATDLNIIIMGE